MICKETKNGNQDILCLYRARLSDEYYLYHHIRYKLVRTLDTIALDAAHHVWLLRVVGRAPVAVLRHPAVKKIRKRGAGSLLPSAEAGGKREPYFGICLHDP